MNIVGAGIMGMTVANLKSGHFDFYEEVEALKLTLASTSVGSPVEQPSSFHRYTPNEIPSLKETAGRFSFDRMREADLQYDKSSTSTPFSLRSRLTDRVKRTCSSALKRKNRATAAAALQTAASALQTENATAASALQTATADKLTPLKSRWTLKSTADEIKQLMRSGHSESMNV